MSELQSSLLNENDDAKIEEDEVRLFLDTFNSYKEGKSLNSNGTGSSYLTPGFNTVDRSDPADKQEESKESEI